MASKRTRFTYAEDRQLIQMAAASATLEEAAARFGTSVETIERKAKSLQLTLKKRGGHKRLSPLQELEEMAARLPALARELPPGQRRYDIMQEIGRFRVQIAALKGPELGRSHRGPKAKEK
jgi:hypothetical protein